MAVLAEVLITEESGVSVSLNSDASMGTILAVGSYKADIANVGADAGCTRIYEYVSGTTWSQIGDSIPGVHGGDQSGKFVDLNDDGTMVIIGAPLNNSIAGKAQVWKNVSGTWEQVGQDIDGDSDNQGFGYSVAINNKGDVIGIGSSNDPGYTGEPLVRVFNLTTSTGAGTISDSSSGWSENSVYYANERIYIDGKIKRNGNAVLYDITGRKILKVESRNQT